MSTPQQPEIARSQRSEVTADVAAKATADTALPAPDHAGAPVPEDNQPGHHPPVEQDKPVGPPPEPKARAPKPRKAKKAAKKPTEVAGGKLRFAFAVDPRIAPVARLIGVTPEQAAVEVDEGELRVRFGPWSLQTPVDNVAAAGDALVPLGWPTFTTRLGGAVRIQFKERVRGPLPFGLLPTRSVTVTVEDPQKLLDALTT
jgi:hypothetical protein